MVHFGWQTADVGAMTGGQVFSKRESVDGATAEQVREVVEQMLPALVAEQLPRLLTDQLAAMGIGEAPVQDDVPGTRRRHKRLKQDNVPSWIHEASAAVADYENQLSSIEFDPESPVTSSTMRRYHWIATEALDTVTRMLDEAGRKDESKAVYAAIGRGRNALIRLDAIRNGRPVPLEVLTAEELAGLPRPERDPHTAERFVWKGREDIEFSLDRPFPHRTALFIVNGTDTNTYVAVKTMERTNRTVRQIDNHLAMSGIPKVMAVTPEVTHLKIESPGEQEWTVRLLEIDELPVLEDMTRAPRGGVYHHTLGDIGVTLQCLDDINLRFHELCDCSARCDRSEHKDSRGVAAFRGEARTEIVLPKKSGVLEIFTKKAWSIDIVPQPGTAR